MAQQKNGVFQSIVLEQLYPSRYFYIGTYPVFFTSSLPPPPKKKKLDYLQVLLINLKAVTQEQVLRQRV